MTVVEFLSSLAKKDIRLWLEGENLRFNAPEGAFTPEVRDEIVARKPEIIKFLASVSTFSNNPITLAPRDKPLTLSFAQQRLWLLVQLEPNSVAYNMPVVLRLEGELQVDVLEKAFYQIISRHEILRTRFDLVDDEAVQVVASVDKWPLPLTDLTELNPFDRENRVLRLAEADATTPFDLLNGPVFRTQLLKLTDREYVLLANMHHIVSDGWSLGLLVNELAIAYSQPGRQLPALPVQYADYAYWQRETLQGERLDKQLEYWRKQLEGVPTLALPIDNPRPVELSDEGGNIPFKLSQTLTNNLNKLALENDVTLFMLLLAAFNVFLFKYSSQTDVCIGSPIANRSRLELEPLIGCFVNTLAFRADLSGDPSFIYLLKQVKQNTSEGFNNQDLPFERLVDELGVIRDMSHTPLFQTFFTLQKNTDKPVADAFGLKVTAITSEVTTAKFDLSLAMVEHDGTSNKGRVPESSDNLEGAFNYRTTLFDKENIERMAINWEVLLNSIVDTPTGKLSELNLLSKKEKTYLLVDLNQTQHEFQQHICIHQMVESQADKTPESCAVVFEGERVSYDSLNKKANQLARYLKTVGVDSSSFVAICLERSIDMVVSLLAVLKAGAAYIPLDPAYPKERTAYMLRHSNARVLLTQESLLIQKKQLVQEKRSPALPDESLNAALITVCIDKPTLLDKIDNTNLELSIEPSQLAYVIYTSGSTGAPKGVSIAHSNVSALVNWSRSVYSSKDMEGVLASTSICFDLSVWEILVTLASGGKIVLVENALDLLSMSGRNEVQLINTVPSVIATLLRENGIPSSVKIINLAGELLKQGLVDRLYSLEGLEKVFDLYGPSEDTTYSTYSLRRVGGRPSIGRPILNTQAFVLDTNKRPVPQGVPGELYLSGMGVSPGYLGQSELTAEVFLENPFVDSQLVDKDYAISNSRLYRTGDQVRYQCDGSLEYLGRIDHQVKIRGFRIELGEVESVILNQGGLDDVLVMASLDANETDILIAYVVVKVVVKVVVDVDVENDNKPSPTATSLRAALKKQLPDYMVPAAIVLLDKFPVTPNGKIDRSKLPQPDVLENLIERSVEPRTEVEQRLAKIWKKLLKLEVVGVKDNYFDLGGNSLSATQLISRMRREFGVELPLRQLFRNPTIEAVASAIEKERSAGTISISPELVAYSRKNNSTIPLSFAQQRLWLVDQLEPDSAAYNMPSALRVQGKLDLNILRRVFDAIINRHEILRTTFSNNGDDVYQDILVSPGEYFSSQDLSHLQGGRQSETVQALVAEEAAKCFDLQTGPLIRVCVLQLGDDDFVLLTTMHHIISDGWSIGLLVNELQTLYNAFTLGEPSPLLSLEFQYADFSQWQREWLQGEVLNKQVHYWRSHLVGVPTLSFPTDYPRSTTPCYRGAKVNISLNVETTSALQHLSTREGSTLYMTLMAALSVLLGRYSGQQDIVVGSPIANRNKSELESLIGFFVNTLAIRTDLSGDPTFLQLLKRVKDTTLAAYANQDVPFEKLVEELDVTRDMARTPLFQVLFTYQNTPELDSISMSGLTISPMESSMEQVKFDLMINMGVINGALVGAVAYKKSLFSQATILRFASHLKVLLCGIAHDADRTISVLPLLSKNELATEIERASPITVDVGGPTNLPQRFSDQARRTPNRSAVVYEGVSVSFSEIDVSSDLLAKRLDNEGVTKGDLVALYLDRSITLMESILAVWKVGAGYVPIDLDTPEERIKLILKDSDTKCILTGRGQFGPVRVLLENTSVCVLDANPKQQSSEKRKPEKSERRYQIDSDATAYVIYTSGTTGVPKGVVVSHSNVVNLMHGLNATIYSDIDFQQSELRVTMNASIAFDSVVKQIIQMLQGATLYPVPAEVRSDVDRLSEFLTSNRIDVFDCTPSQISVLLSDGLSVESAERAAVSLPKKVLLGGESISQGLWKTLCLMATDPLSTTKFYNLYGPTECTVDSTVALVSDSDLMPHIGKPIANVQCFILDSKLLPVPQGVVGELFIGGIGVSKGYLNNVGLTDISFVSNPFGEGLLYKTGDRVRYLANNNIQFIGRVDDQVKLRGYRIELAEIEVALGSLEGVSEAVASIQEREDEFGAGGEAGKVLVAYVVLSSEYLLGFDYKDSDSIVLVENDLLAQLKGVLPAYMIPMALSVIDKLPLTINGKVDKKALPALMVNELGVVDYEKPSTEIEITIQDIWQRVLKRKDISITEDFFSIGGHSLLATRVVSRVRRQYRIEFPLRELFDNPSIKLMAHIVEQMVERGDGVSTDIDPIVPVIRDKKMRLSFAQQRMWVLEQLDPGSAAYNMPISLRLKGTLNADILLSVFNELVNRHEVLRTTFHPVAINEEGGAYANIHDAFKHVMPIINLSNFSPEDAEDQLLMLSAKEAAKGFDLSEGPLFRTSLIKVNALEWGLLVTMHHMVSDGWSIGILVEELSTLYEVFSRGEPTPLVPLNIQYVDFAHWQTKTFSGDILTQQMEYWREKIKPESFVLNLPTDFPRSMKQSTAAGSVSITLSPALTINLEKLNRQENCTLYMALLTSFSILLQRYTGQYVVNVGSPIAGRNRVDIEPLVGFFINTLVMSVELSGDPSYRQLLSRVKETAHGAYAHQDLPFEKLVQELQPERDLSRTPLFQVFLNMLNLPSAKKKIEGLSIEGLFGEGFQEQSKFDITLYVKELGVDAGIALHLVYNRSLFDAHRMEIFLEHFQSILEAVVRNPDCKIGNINLSSIGAAIEPNFNESIQVEEQWDSPLLGFDTVVNENGHSVAIVDKNGSWTYCQLHDASIKVASTLLPESSESLVLVYAARRATLAVTLIACLRAGIPFVILDPSSALEKSVKLVNDVKPTHWIQLTTSKIPVELEGALSTQQLVSRLTLPDNYVSLVLQSEKAHTELIQNKSGQSNFGQYKNVSYLSVTSGTTGEPKLIATGLNPLNHFLQWYRDEFEINATDRFTLLSGLAHDPLLRDIFTPLSIGAQLHIPDSESLAESGYLSQWFFDQKITVTHLTPSLSQMLLSGVSRDDDGNIAEDVRLDSLRLVCFSGEKLYSNVVAEFSTFAPIVQCINFYGTTETPQAVAYKRIDVTKISAGPSLISIGKGIKGVDLLILNERMNNVVVSEIGEICIRSPYLSSGYHNDLALTESKYQRIVRNDNQEIIYRTGDLGRYLPNGDVEVLGRNDRQINIRGYRVELAEIEFAIKSTDLVDGVCVTPQSGKEQEGGLLVAYVVNLGDVEILRSAIASLLPIYMVPAAFVAVNAIPLTPNGKVDYSLLPKIDPNKLSCAQYEEPTSEVGVAVAEVWMDVLNVEKVGLNDNFFNLGGHSLLATKVVARLKAMYELELPLRSLFENPTLSNLVNHIETALWFRANEDRLGDDDRKDENSNEDDEREEFEF